MYMKKQKKVGPAKRWAAKHGYKTIHRWRITAWWHAKRISKHHNNVRFEIYECRWGKWYFDGETSRKHYHVGRPSTK